MICYVERPQLTAVTLTRKFGQKLNLQPIGCGENILEAKVGTNLGDYEFNFQ